MIVVTLRLVPSLELIIEEITTALAGRLPAHGLLGMFDVTSAWPYLRKEEQHQGTISFF